jgi:hypothetical protein
VIVAFGFLIILLFVTAVTARWSSARARRRTVTFLTRVAALPAIGASTRRSHRASSTTTAPGGEARLYFLDVYRDARRRRGVAVRSADDRLPRSFPTLSLEHPRAGRGA